MALSAAHDRLKALMEAGSIIKKVRMLVFFLETQLERTQATVEELEALASDSYFFDGPIPPGDVIRAFWRNTLSLKGAILRGQVNNAQGL